MHNPLGLLPATMAMLLSLAAEPTLSSRDLAHGPFVRQAAEKAVAEFADEIEANYLFPELGKSYASLLRRNLQASRYARFSTDREFTDAVETDLAAIKPDRHLHLIAPSVPTRGVVGTASAATGTCPTGGTQIERSIGKSGWLAPGIAYVEFCALRDGRDDVAALRTLFDVHSAARVLIIDNRNNNGGGFDEADIIMSRLFAAETVVLQLDIRRSVDDKMPFPFTDGFRWKRLPSDEVWAKYRWFAQPAKDKAGLRNAKVFVLTSRWTQSAGEAVTLALKASGRAVVIGEPTHGAGHLAPTLPLPGGYRGQVPIGRIYDPRTGVGIEGVGVSPAVSAPAEQALAKALEMSNVNVADGLRKWAQLATLQPKAK